MTISKTVGEEEISKDGLPTRWDWRVNKDIDSKQKQNKHIQMT